MVAGVRTAGSVEAALTSYDFDALVAGLQDIGVASMAPPISQETQARIFDGMRLLTRLPEDEQRPWRLEDVMIPDPHRGGVMEPDFGLRPPKQEGPQDDNKYSLMICDRALQELLGPRAAEVIKYDWQWGLLQDLKLVHGVMEAWFAQLAFAVARQLNAPNIISRVCDARTIVRVLEYTDDRDWGGGQVGETHYDKSVFTTAIGADKPGLQIRGQPVPATDSRVFVGGRAPHGLLGLDPPRFPGRGKFPPANHGIVVPEGTDPGRFALVAFQWMHDLHGAPCKFIRCKVGDHGGVFPDADLPSI